MSIDLGTKFKFFYKNTNYIFVKPIGTNTYLMRNFRHFLVTNEIIFVHDIFVQYKTCFSQHPNTKFKAQCLLTVFVGQFLRVKKKKTKSDRTTCRTVLLSRAENHH